MRHHTILATVLVGLLGSACSENEVNFRDVPPDVPRDGVLRGQVCDPEAQVWMEGATVYTHLYDENGVVYDTVTDITDAEGKYELALPTGLGYDIYVARGNDLVEQFHVDIPEGLDVDLPPPSCFGDVDLKVALVTGAYDDLATLFNALGIATYKEVDGQANDELVDFLSSPEVMAEYEVIFFDGGHAEEGVIYPAGDPVVDQINANLREYVQNGGVVFASDWAYDLVEQNWPEKVDFLGDDLVPDAAQKGDPGDMNAIIADDFMSAAIGLGQVTVHYDMSVYPLIETVDDSTRVYLTADMPWRNGQVVETVPDSPLAVSFEDGNGRVYYTGYRNAANGAGQMLDVLRYLLGALQ